MLLRSIRAAVIAAGAMIALGASPALANSIGCCSVSSDGTPASWLAATFDFQVAGTTLTLTVTNDTVVPTQFNISEVFFNASASVTSLALLGANHSANGDQTAAWLPVETNVMVDGFGMFDFGVTDGMGQNDPSLIGPGENTVFTFSITGTGPFSDLDFGPEIAAKFVNGPDDPENPGYEDSAWGTVPEPGTAVLVATGLIGLVAGRRSTRTRA